MNFDATSVWKKYRAQPKWAQIASFAFVVLVVGGLAIWAIVRKASNSKSAIDAPLDVVEEHFEEAMETAQSESEALDVVIEYEQDWRETLKQKQERDHETAERIRDEIHNADSISDVTNALRDGRG
jgi:hypothetical protein